MNEPGYIYAPYRTVIVSTQINGETVWYKNKLKNLWLKIKFFFIKPKYYKLMKKYPTKPINPKYYGIFKIKE